MTNRIFSLPSGRKVVLQSPDLDTLSELHEMKLRVMNSNPLLGLESLQTSTPRMRDFITDAVHEPGIAITRREPSYFNRKAELSKYPAETPEDFRTELARESAAYIPGLALDVRGIKDIISPQIQARLKVISRLLDPDTNIIGTPKKLSVNPAFTAFLEERQYTTRGLTHPRDTFSNSLDSFNRKAKKLGKKL